MEICALQFINYTKSQNSGEIPELHSKIIRIEGAINLDETSIKSEKTPKSTIPYIRDFKLLIFSDSPLGAGVKSDKNQQLEGFLDRTHD